MTLTGPFKVLEVGAGTGIFTRALLADEGWNASIRRLTAVEPSKGMRDLLCQKVRDPRVDVADGIFQSTQIAEKWADVILIAQAYHWCTDFNAATVEFARVLKPGGIVALTWNSEDRLGADWVSQIWKVLGNHEEGTPVREQTVAPDF
ncbi:S-adenosyl-L-methionine-dependent methyltransferase [Crepidotus variabilis]|uniref:S-adenosyl-L-methionine-dependent methyltransferase n=1 Tax=Crepidotus variabilis TaxID=179855 RepID=A0A9P6END1_9AGAR|nr:S-adenosyl-L-methionine-dependent methyltransferase [Crepidotus variabilis]